METSDTTLTSQDDMAENKIDAALRAQDDNALRDLLSDIHPADFSDQFEQLTTEARGAPLS